MAACTRCSKEVGFLGALVTKQSSATGGRCVPCEVAYKASLVKFRMAFLSACADGLISGDEWNRLVALIQQERLNAVDAFAFVRTDALNLLQRSVTMASADGAISDAEYHHLLSLQAALQIPDAVAHHALERVNRLRYISYIRTGHLPALPAASIRLASDEVCYMEMEASFQKVNTQTLGYIPGRFVATSKKLHFLSPSGGVEMDWRKIMRVDRHVNGVYLELSIKKGNGFYVVPDPLYAEAVIDTAIRLSNREVLAPQPAATMTRHIPQDVKIAVWQRDNGICVQCGDNSYLEFDHIIPHSRGGANTLNNIQLLCRGCNVRKGSMI